MEQITAFLFANGGHEDPKQLVANAGKSFQGSIVLGMGFTFDESDSSDNDTSGTPSPIATMERLIADNPKNTEVIFPYIGGEEVNSSPTHAHHRYVIDFRDRSEEECRSEWPDLMNLIEKKVKPERTRKKPNGEFALRSPLPQRWWHHADKRPALYSEISGRDRVLATCIHTPQYSIAPLSAQSVFSHALVVFSLPINFISLIQGSLHELWARFLGSSLGDGLRYTPSDCFETFPFPANFLDGSHDDPSRLNLEAIGERFHQFRSELMVCNNEGLTNTYNRFHDPSETSPGLIRLRELHQEMDQAVLNVYGWGQVRTECGFGLDYLDLEEDAQVPEDLQDRIDCGDLFFLDAYDALDFQGQLQAYGAIKAKKRLPWRYRWPDAVRDDVLARLLALNAERYQEEVDQGLHGGGRGRGSGGSSGGSGTGRRRGRPPKNPPTGSDQIGLSL